MVTPMFHIAALNLTYQPAIMIGATVVFARKWQITDFAELCQQQADTAPFLVPTQVIGILNEPGLDFA